jgi:hypothetical protein
MSLFTLNIVNTPRDRVFGRLKQYINVNATNARTSGTRFLASSLTPIRAPQIENWSAEIKAKFDLQIASGNTSKQVLIATKRSAIIWHLQNPTIELKGATHAKRAFNSNMKYNANTNYKL